MAEGDSSSEHCELLDQFNRAINYLPNLVAQLDSQRLLQFYAFYKQATVGPCNVARPGWFQMQAKQKWDAWNSLGDMSSEIAMHEYVTMLDKVDPEWRQQDSTQSTKGWVAVSCMFNDEQELSDAEKTLVDWVKEGNQQGVGRALAQDRSAVNTPDETGLLPIHWAADRGHTSIVKMLIEADADKNAVDPDGQTPLHYAASCGHSETLRFLLDAGAQILKDNDALTPKDVATQELVSLFSK